MYSKTQPSTLRPVSSAFSVPSDPTQSHPPLQRSSNTGPGLVIKGEVPSSWHADVTLHMTWGFVAEASATGMSHYLGRQTFGQAPAGPAVMLANAESGP